METFSQFLAPALLAVRAPVFVKLEGPILTVSPSGRGGNEPLPDVSDRVGQRLDWVARAEAEHALGLRGIDEEPVLAHLHVRGGQIGLAAARAGKTLEEMRRGHLHGAGQAQRRGRL